MAPSATTSWHGSYYDGRTARRHRVAVSVTAAGIYIAREEGQTLWWLHDQVRLVQGHHPGEPVRLEHITAMAEAVVVEDGSFLKAYLEAAPSSGRLATQAAAKLNRSVPLLVGAIFGVAFLIYAAWMWGLPALSDAAAARVPASWERQMGESVLEQFAPLDQRCENPEAMARIQEVIQRMRGQSDKDYEVTLAVVNHPMENAFAAPGGYVVVFRGLLEQTQNAEDFAGVLAHELQHVEQKHATKGIVRQLSLAALVALVAGDASAVKSLLNAAATLGSLRYQRVDEQNADTEAVHMLQAAHIDAGGLPRMLERMSKEESHVSSELQYLSSHPLTSDRVRRLEALAAQPHTAPSALLEDFDWMKVAHMCEQLPTK